MATGEPLLHPSQNVAEGKRPESATRHFRILSLVFLSLLTVLPYLNALSNGFVFDDFDQVLSNPYIRDFHHLRQIFSTGVWSYRSGFTANSNYYRPMMMLGYAVTYKIFGPQPLAFHLASLLLHLAVVLMVFNVTWKMFADARVALATAACFALHPIHSEAVDWIAAVTELEVTLFFLLTFRFFLAADARGGRRVLAQLGMGASFALALLSKEQAVMLPFLATIYEHFYRHDRCQTTWTDKILRYGLLWPLTFGYVFLRVDALKAFAPVVRRPGMDSTEVALGALALIGQYLSKLVWPAHLSAFYVFPHLVYLLASWMLAGFVSLILCAGLFAVLWKHSRPASFGLPWIFISLGPVLNARWMPDNVFSERYLYLPSVGFCWIAGWLAVKLWEAAGGRNPSWRGALALAGSLLAALCVARIVTRNPVWRNNLVFYQRTLAAAPGAYAFHNNLGKVYWDQGNATAAEQEWREALRLAPNYSYALRNMGLVMQHAKRYADAVQYFQKALRSAPDYPDAELSLGTTYASMGLRDKAETELKAAIKLDPASIAARNALGDLYLDEKRLDDVEAQSRSSLALQPNLHAYWNLGFARWLKGDYAGAEQAFQSAQSLDPASARGHLILGVFYAARGRNREAIQQYRAGLRIDPSNAEAIAALKKLTGEIPKTPPPKRQQSPGRSP